MTTGIQKVPPHDENAEKSVLGGLLIDSGAINTVAEILQPKHFYFDEHAKIYSAILTLFDKSKPIDVITLAAQLKEDGELKKAGGAAFLSDLIETVPTSAYVKHYAEIVRHTYVKRKLISMASKLVEQSFDEKGEVSELLNTAETEIFSLSQSFLKRDFTEIKEILAESFERLETFMKSDSQLRGVPTGFSTLDNKLAGMQDSNLLILAARPGVGKTTFALNMAMHVALKEKMPVGFFSLEMSKEELVDRLLVGQADIDAWRLKTGKLSDEDYSRLTQAMGELAEAPIFIDDTPGASILEMRTKARKLMIEKNLKLIVVDYLQLATTGHRVENRVHEVGMISQSLKNLARELKVPVLALSQLSRAIEHRGEKRPQLADLRESGCLAGSTRITRADTGEQVAIKDLEGHAKFDVWSMTSDLKIQKMPVSRVFCSGRKQLFTLKFRSGRSIQATANHKFRTYTSWKRLDALKIGDRLAEPRHMQQPLSDNTNFLDEELIFLAHMVGDGCYVQHQPVHYTSATTEHIEIVRQTAKYLFDIDGRVVSQNSWQHVYLPSPFKLSRRKHHPFVDWLKKHSLKLARSHEKKLPNELYLCSERQIGLFLRHLWSTDGSITISNGKIRIYYASNSRKLTNQVQALLLRLGILSTVHCREQIKHNKKFRNMYNVDIQGSLQQILFLKKVGTFGSKHNAGQLALKILNRKMQNPNVDVMDKTIWEELIKPAKKKAGVTWREFAKSIEMSYCGSTLFKHGVSRDRMGRIAQALESKVLEAYATSDIFWDEIIDIVPGEVEDVYDMTVPGTHNFVANDIVVHNSIEQDADVVMFLYGQDEADELMDDSKKMIKLLIAKHRNGPTGEIDLMFRGDRVRFFGVDSSEK